MPGPVRNRHSGTPDLGAGPGRIRGGLADPQWAPDREPDRFAADDRSGTTGRHTGALGPYSPRLPYRHPLVVLPAVPLGEHQLAAWDEQRVGARLWRVRSHARHYLSSL